MRTEIVTAVLLVAAAGAGGAMVALQSGTSIGQAATTQTAATDSGGERPYDWQPEREASGEIPTFREAMTKLDRIGYVDIEGNDGFAPANGVVSGSGTPEDPYVFSGVYAGELDVRDTDAWFTVENSYIETLRLNWNDQHVWVHHNRIGDLRVNENDPRTGNATGGIIEHNAIDYVGQIRHFDGVFRNNVVGADDLATPSWRDAFDTFQEAINIDGYVNAEFYENEIHGQVTVDLHGHGHASCRGCHPHNHFLSMNETEKAMAEEYQEDKEEYDDKPFQNVSYAHDHDHSRRYHTIEIHHNTIEDPDGRGLYIEDRNHDGDDRTANSEPDPQMMGDHWHDILVDVHHNTIRKAGIDVDVMYADDEYHVPGGQAEIRIEHNTVETGETRIVDIYEVQHADVLVADNTLKRTSDDTDWRVWHRFGTTTGVVFDVIEDSTLVVRDNEIADVDRGVAAEEMPGNTTWSVVGNTFVAVEEPVWWDDSVENEPTVRDNEVRGGSDDPL